MQIFKLHYKMPLAPQNQTLPKPNTQLPSKLQTTFLPALMEKNGRRNGNVGGQGGSQQCWSAIVPPPPLPGTSQCLNKAATHFSDIAMHTLFLEKNNTMVKILKERNGWIGVALKLCF